MQVLFGRRTAVFLGWLALCSLTLAGSAGCSGARSGSRVSGTVTVKGTPVKAGYIKFLSGDKTVGSAAIKADGTYVTSGIPDGDLQITVEQSKLGSLIGQGGDDTPVVVAPKAAPKAAPKKAAEPQFDTGGGPTVPPKFKDPKSSGLKVTVSGSTTHNIEM